MTIVALMLGLIEIIDFLKLRMVTLIKFETHLDLTNLHRTLRRQDNHFSIATYDLQMLIHGTNSNTINVFVVFGSIGLRNCSI